MYKNAYRLKKAVEKGKSKVERFLGGLSISFV